MHKSSSSSESSESSSEVKEITSKKKVYRPIEFRPNSTRTSSVLSNKVKSYQTKEFSIFKDQRERKESTLDKENERRSNCGHCKKPIYEESPIQFDSKLYHRFCFRCSSCNKQLDNSINQAYQCEAEKRLYCISCCDCKCWLTGNKDAKTRNKEPETIKNTEPTKVKSDLNLKLKSNLNELDGAKKDFESNRNDSKAFITPNSVDENVKRCEYCNQILRDNLQKDINSFMLTRTKTVQIPKPPKLPELNRLEQNTKLLAETENLAIDNKTRLHEQSFKQQLKSQNRTESTNDQKEAKKIRLVRKPVIGPRIAKIIDKLENSLNPKIERKFQKSFYRNVEQSLEQTQDKKRNSVDKLKTVEDNSILERERDKKLEHFNEKLNETFNEYSNDNRKQNQTKKDPLIKDSRLNSRFDREQIFCPNCKIVLPVNLFFKAGNCKPFCTFHCPYELSNANKATTFSRKDDKLINDDKQSIHLTVNETKSIHKLPYNLLLNSTKNTPLKRTKPIITNDIRADKKTSNFNEQQIQLESETAAAVCCKCGLRVYLNDNVNNSATLTPFKC